MERKDSGMFLDAQMDHGNDHGRNADALAISTESAPAGLQTNQPAKLERGQSVPEGVAGAHPDRPGLPNKVPSYRVRSDGTAEVSSFVDHGTGDRHRISARPTMTYSSGGSIHGMGSRGVGAFSTRFLIRKLNKADSKSRRNLRRSPAKSEREGSTDLDSVNEKTQLVSPSAKKTTFEITDEERAFADEGSVIEQPEEERPGTLRALCDICFGKAISLLLVFLPFAWASQYYGWGPVAVFWLNFLAMVPLASILGDFTEEVAAHTNQVIGGLINASFGNAVEVVVAIQALMANEIRVVQASMIGSIFSNLLLVLGGCFFFGGMKHKEQTYNSTAATANMSLLALSSLALVLPTPFAEYYEVEDEHVLIISRIAACFLIFMYLQLLVFQLRTHVHLFNDDDDEEAEVPFWTSVGGLVVVTLIIAKLSDYLVGSIDGFCEESGVSRTFVGLIILPIVGNAVEHITAINVAMKDKMDLAMGVAVGSCTQISLFVIPVTVIVGWVCGKDMTLNFPQFEITLFVLSIVIVSICISNPKSNWLEGSLLMTTYLMIAVGFWFEKVVSYNGPSAEL
mmetsp:Transcript_29349/g.86962  ORF Transcript_29349/g.86962 Transcript_29349/m.86962 type:complete len:568 (-) Transcript_29349:453-2156(-)